MLRSAYLNLTPLAAFLLFLRCALQKNRKKATRGVRFKSGLSFATIAGTASDSFVGPSGCRIRMATGKTIARSHCDVTMIREKIDDVIMTSQCNAPRHIVAMRFIVDGNLACQPWLMFVEGIFLGNGAKYSISTRNWSRFPGQSKGRVNLRERSKPIKPMWLFLTKSWAVPGCRYGDKRRRQRHDRVSDRHLLRDKTCSALSFVLFSHTMHKKQVLCLGSGTIQQEQWPSRTRC